MATETPSGDTAHALEDVGKKERKKEGKKEKKERKKKEVWKDETPGVRDSNQTRARPAHGLCQVLEKVTQPEIVFAITITSAVKKWSFEAG